MNHNVSNFYRSTAGKDPVRGHFHSVIALHKQQDLSFEKVLGYVPDFPRGWFELCRLPQAYRIEFTRDFWLAKLPYHVEFYDYLPLFFADVEDVGVFLTQTTFQGPFKAHMVYSLHQDGGFFSGQPPCSEENLDLLIESFPDVLLPSDYVAFLQVHDGFSKSTDAGVIPAKEMGRTYSDLQAFFSKQDPLLTADGIIVDPKTLIPFYESFGLHCYQCFYSEWYPRQEMGNLYYSGIEHSISDFHSRGSLGENLAFPTFLDWLLFYLKGIDEV